MGQMPVLRTSSELYPPKARDEVTRLVERIVAFRPDEPGKPPELHRALSVPERSDLEARKNVLDKWLEPGSPNLMKLAINEMMTGFGGHDLDEEASDHRNANYAFTCRDRPLWAVERACLRFRRGEVRADEVGEKSLSLTWRPSSAQLNVIAKKIEEKECAERHAIGEILRATVFLPPPSAGKERAEDNIGAVADHWRKRAAAKYLETAERELSALARRADNAKLAEERRVKSFRDAGIEPPELLPGQIGVSLQMYLAFGWKIEEVGGKRVLISPPKIAPRLQPAGTEPEVPF